MTILFLNILSNAKAIKKGVRPTIEILAKRMRRFSFWTKNLTDPLYFFGTKQVFLFSYLIAKEKEAKEKAVEISCQDAQVDGGSTSDFDHHWHEAVQAKHTEGKCHKQQSCEKRKISNIREEMERQMVEKLGCHPKLPGSLTYYVHQKTPTNSQHCKENYQCSGLV